MSRHVLENQGRDTPASSWATGLKKHPDEREMEVSRRNVTKKENSWISGMISLAEKCP